MGLDYRTKVTKELFLHAYGGFLQADSPAPYQGNRGYYAVAKFPDGEYNYCYLTMKVPDDFVSFVSVKAVWASVPAAGDMSWKLSARYAAGGEFFDEHDDSPTIGVTATGGAEIINVQEPANPLTLASLELGDYIGLRFARAGDSALDTLDADVYLLGLLFTYMGVE